MQLVDPFIPATPRKQPPTKPLPPKPAHRQPVQRPVDGFTRPQSAAPAFVHPRTQTSPTAPPPRPTQTRPHQARPQPKQVSKKPSRKRKTLNFVGQVLFVVGAMVLGLLAQSVIIGQVAVLIYGVCAVLFRIASRTTFLLALMSLGVVVIAIVRSQTALASAFAVYVFLLLGVGTLTLARELRNEI